MVYVAVVKTKNKLCGMLILWKKEQQLLGIKWLLTVPNLYYILSL